MTAGMVTTQTAGRQILLLLIACFGVLFAVNGFFMYKAISTGPGEANGASYEAGLHYNETLAAQHSQDSLGWHHAVTLDGANLRIAFRNKDGEPVSGLNVTGSIERPAVSQEARSLAFKEGAAGLYEVTTGLGAGAWVIAAEARSSHAASPDRFYRLKERLWIRKDLP